VKVPAGPRKAIEDVLFDLAASSTPEVAPEESPGPVPEVAARFMTRQDSGHKWTNRR